MCPMIDRLLACRYDDVMARWSYLTQVRFLRGWIAVGLLCSGMVFIRTSQAKDLLAPKEQKTTEVGVTQSPSFDEQQKGIPQSLFTWIKMAKGYEIEWDTFGRIGWYAQDPRLRPVEPAAVFPQETPAIYIVFEVAPLEEPAQFAVQWFRELPGGQLSREVAGKDVLEVPGHERYGYLEMKKSGARWEAGNYVATLFIAPLGQQPFHAVNQVGTMRFSIVDAPVPRAPDGSR
jgi:hypothetical protein